MRNAEDLKTALQALEVRTAPQAPTDAPPAAVRDPEQPQGPAEVTPADLGAALRAAAAPSPSVTHKRRRRAAP